MATEVLARTAKVQKTTVVGPDAVHAGHRADALDRSLDAKAFTTGGAVQRWAPATTPATQAPNPAGAKPIAGQHRAPAGATPAGPSKAEHRARAGAHGEVNQSTSASDGRTETSTSHKAEGLAGAEALCKTIVNASDEELRAAVELLARAGAFGSSEREAAVKRGALGAAARGKAAGGAGASAGGSAEARVEKNGVLSAVAAAADLYAKLAIEGDVSGELEATLGPLTTAVYAKLDAFLGIMVKIKGEADISLTHLYVDAGASAFAGAKGKAEAGAKAKLSDTEANVGLRGSALAGALAEAEGQIKIDLTGVEVQASASAFAGAKADAELKGSLQHKGRTVLSARGKIGVNAGVGGEVDAEFMFRKGRLVIGGDFTESMGWGCDVGATVEIDFYILSLMIRDEAVKLFLRKKEEINRRSPEVERIPLVNPRDQVKYRKLGYETVLDDFNRYRAKKTEKGAAGIKLDVVQGLIDRHRATLSEGYQFVEVDEGLKLAAKDAFGSELVYIDLQGGVIRAFQAKAKEAPAKPAPKGAKGAKGDKRRRKR